MPTFNAEDGRELAARLRSGYQPTDAEADAWTVADTIDTLRGHITDADLNWLAARIGDDEGPRAAFFLALSKPLANRPEIRSLLALRFKTANPHLKAELLWRLLDDPNLPDDMHRELFSFVIAEWETFKGCFSYLGGPSEIIEAALRRMGDCPKSKRWIYLCCLPQYAADQHAVKGLLIVANGSTDSFTADVARVLLDRFF